MEPWRDGACPERLSTSVTLLRVELEGVSVLGMSLWLERLLSGSWMMWWPVGPTPAVELRGSTG